MEYSTDNISNRSQVKVLKRSQSVRVANGKLSLTFETGHIPKWTELVKFDQWSSFELVKIQTGQINIGQTTKWSNYKAVKSSFPVLRVFSELPSGQIP